MVNIYLFTQRILLTFDKNDTKNIIFAYIKFLKFGENDPTIISFT